MTRTDNLSGLSDRAKQRPESVGESLQDGSRVAVIGAGPAGSMFSYFLLNMAEAVALDVNVDMFEPRRFCHRGPAGCNHCGGVVSESLVQRLATEGIRLPDSVVRRGVESYTLHMDVGDVEIATPLMEKRNVAVGSDITIDELRGRHTLMFLGLGAQAPRDLGIPGEKGPGVSSGIAYLKQRKWRVESRTANRLSLSAEAAHAELRGEPHPDHSLSGSAVRAGTVKSDYYRDQQRQRAPRRPPEEWLVDPELEIGQTMSSEQACSEAARCMSCGMCFDCQQCFMYCNAGGFTRIEETSPGHYFALTLDACEGCGKCIEICPCGYLESRDGAVW